MNKAALLVLVVCLRVVCGGAGRTDGPGPAGGVGARTPARLVGGMAPPPGFPLPFVTKTTRELAGALGSKDVRVRRAAVNRLYFRKWNAQPAVPALTAALKDPDADVRAMAAGCFYFLDVRPDHGVAPVLADLLVTDPSDKVRGSCAKTLALLSHDKRLTGGFGPAAAPAVPRLIRVIRDDDGPDGWVGKYAIEALRAIGPAARPATPALVKALRYRGYISRLRAAQTLAAIGADPNAAVPAMVAALGDDERAVRAQVAIAVGSFGPRARAAVPRLTRLLRDPESDVREAAAGALKRIKGEP